MKTRVVTSGAAVIAAAALAFLTPAFGHGEHDHGSHPAAAYGEPADPKAPAREIVVIMKEGDGRMLFAPDVIPVKRGEQIKFRFRNEGLLDHEFILGTPAEIEAHADMMKAMPDMVHDDPNSRRVATNASGDMTWHFTTAGEFDFACLIPGHREAGMTGKIIVK